MPYDDLIEFLKAGNRLNSTSFSSGFGKADITFEREYGKPLDLRLGRGTLDSGYDSREIKWWFDRDQFRTDEVPKPLPVGKKQLGLPVDRKTVWNSDVRIYLDHQASDTLHAYLNYPRASNFRFVRDSLSYFNPLLYFNVDDHDLSGWLDYINNQKMDLSVTTLPNQIYQIMGFHADDYGVTRKLRIIVDGKLGYNVTRMQFWATGGNKNNDPVFDFTASYEQVDAHPLFFPKEYSFKRFFDDEHLNWESIKASFTNISINVPIAPETFTFKGLGVPDGIPFTDMRADPPLNLRTGQSLSSRTLDSLVDQLPSSPVIDNSTALNPSEHSGNTGQPDPNLNKVTDGRSARYVLLTSGITCLLMVLALISLFKTKQGSR